MLMQFYPFAPVLMVKTCFCPYSKASAGGRRSLDGRLPGQQPKATRASERASEMVLRYKRLSCFHVTSATLLNKNLDLELHVVLWERSCCCVWGQSKESGGNPDMTPQMRKREEGWESFASPNSNTNSMGCNRVLWMSFMDDPFLDLCASIFAPPRKVLRRGREGWGEILEVGRNVFPSSVFE